MPRLVIQGLASVLIMNTKPGFKLLVWLHVRITWLMRLQILAEFHWCVSLDLSSIVTSAKLWRGYDMRTKRSSCTLCAFNCWMPCIMDKVKNVLYDFNRTPILILLTAILFDSIDYFYFVLLWGRFCVNFLCCSPLPPMFFDFHDGLVPCAVPSRLHMAQKLIYVRFS